MVSPLCEVKDGAGAYGSTATGVDVTPANTITIRLADPNVDSWLIQCITTDETNVAATIQAGLTINSLTKTATFTGPATGSALRFRSKVNGGIGPDGVVRSDYSTTFCVFTPTAGGDRTIASDQSTEGSPYGWITSLNEFIRSGAGASFVPPTGTGLMTVTGGAMNAAATVLGTGVATWFTTPSSTNLRSAMTDPTGTAGRLVFSNAPTFTTPKINNTGATFTYDFAVSALAANRTVTLPLLATNDTFAFEAFAQSLTSKTIVAASNTITDTSAATGDLFYYNGTRFVRFPMGSSLQVLRTNVGATTIEWAAAALGANVTSGTNYISLGAVAAASGALRMEKSTFIGVRNAANSADLTACAIDAADNLYIGTDTAFTGAKQFTGLNIYAVSSVALGIAGTTYQYLTGGLNESWKPAVGSSAGSSPWGAVDGQAVVAVAGSNITLTAAQYSRRIVKFTGAPAATRTITFPHPASDDESYTRIIWPQQTVSVLLISTGTGTTYTMPSANDFPKEVIFTPAGVSKIVAT